jgi:acetyl esterase/lipase
MAARTLPLAAVGCVIALSAYAAEPITLSVWPGKPPGETGITGPETQLPEQPGQRKVIRLTNVSEPTIAVYSPPTENRNDAAVVICPGGGYRILAMDLEGTEVAEWLNSIGLTGIVLKYRVPVPSPVGNAQSGVPDAPLGVPAAPLHDVQRSISLVRSKAAEWKINADKIGVLGFSAGGNLAAAACTMHARRSYESLDEVDLVSCRPDFGVLVYPGYLADDEGRLRPSFKPTGDTPPMFFAHAQDDRVKPENSIAMFLALKEAGVPGELHIYSAGGHGFGLRASDFPCSSWPQRCESWLVQQKVLVPKQAPAIPMVK